MVEYGTPTPISQIGNISVPEPYACHTAMGCGDYIRIEKAINKSDMELILKMTEKLFVLFSPRPQKSEDVSWLSLKKAERG